jgi:hypothetical protein
LFLSSIFLPLKPIGEIKMQIEKKEVILGGFNNDKLLKGNNKYHQIFTFGSNK